MAKTHHATTGSGSIRAFYGIGQKSLKKHPGRMPHGQMASAAEQFGLHPEMLRKARTFAQEYSEEEMKELCRLCRQHRAAIGPSFVIRFVTLKDKSARRKFQRQAIAAGWSRWRVDGEILRRFGRRRAAGRSCHVPADAEEAYYELFRLCGKWRRLYEALQKTREGGKSKGPIWNALPQQIQRQIEQANQSMGSLEKLLLEKTTP